jgi:transposase
VLEPAVYSGAHDRAGRVNMPEETKAETLSTEVTGATRSAETARALIRKTKRATRRRFPTEDKIRIVMEGVRREISIAELCRREGIHPTIYYKWLKDFMEAGKARMRGDTLREATSDEVKLLRQEEGGTETTHDRPAPALQSGPLQPESQG